MLRMTLLLLLLVVVVVAAVAAVVVVQALVLVPLPMANENRHPCTLKLQQPRYAIVGLIYGFVSPPDRRALLASIRR